jgi:hypothetical protein
VVIFKNKTKASEKKKIFGASNPSRKIYKRNHSNVDGELKSDETKFFYYFRTGLSNAAPAGAMVPATYFPGARDILSWHPILLCQL